MAIGSRLKETFKKDGFKLVGFGTIFFLLGLVADLSALNDTYQRFKQGIFFHEELSKKIPLYDVGSALQQYRFYSEPVAEWVFGMCRDRSEIRP
ncbi:hypothetical protein GCM10011505_39510 [Tistrella bauzanensis]|uniref:Uncharacterized protein n=1 Tax=Tistrella bauzanensis TaxID=657419 RepID=A0ABQ1J105_9PROT|nr:hypothetical protein [Tistrella bauzanensis]GGB54635.1 hypothetical protein GCM10011505_39510 [Tistrella bauzanensis]